jgi:hypothetical protein
MEAQFVHDREKKLTFHFVKGFLHININCHKSTTTSFRFKRVEHLMREDRVILDMSAWNESSLKWRNNFRQERLKPISQKLRDDLVNNVAKTNRAEMMNR